MDETGTTADIAVIGGGIAGLSFAAAVGRAARVVVLEAEPLLFHHTSSRSAEQMQPTYGPDPVRRLTLASIPIVEREVQADVGPILMPRPLLWFGTEADDSIDRLIIEIPGLRPLTPDEAVALLPALRRDRIRAAAIDEGAVEVRVPTLLEWYRSRAVAAGAIVRTGARVRSASRIGDTWTLVADDGGVTAPVVVDAAGAWADRVAALFGARPAGLAPLRRTVVVAPTRGTRVDPGWPMAGDAHDTIYFRPRGDAVLASCMEDEASEPLDATPRDEIIRRTIERVDATTTFDLGEPIRAWTGLRTLSADTAPVVGRDPEVPGFFWLAGQGGYGIQTSAALSRLAADDLLGTATAPEGLAGVLDDLAPARGSIRA